MVRTKRSTDTLIEDWSEKLRSDQRQFGSGKAYHADVRSDWPKISGPTSLSLGGLGPIPSNFRSRLVGLLPKLN
jgi:hypothetical protein